jgi:ribonuclease Z
MFEHDLEHRSNPFKREDLDIKVKEVAEGVVYDEGGVTVTAFPVEHHDGNPAFGYRLDAGNRSVLLSGDTTYHENVVKYGKGVDVMVHNVVAFSEAMLKAGAMKPVLDKLTTPEQAAQVFTKAAPRLALFSHIVKKELPGAAGDDIVLTDQGGRLCRPPAHGHRPHDDRRRAGGRGQRAAPHARNARAR